VMPMILTALAGLLAAAPLPPAPAPDPPAPVAAPKIVRLDPPEDGFFSKQLDYHGILIKSHAVVADEALLAAYGWLDRLLGRQEAARRNLADAGAQLHIIGKDQVTSDLPECRQFKGKPYDGKLTIDERTRGVGGLVASCGEENLLKLPGDRYKGRNICIHEFTHTLFAYGLSADVRDRIKAQYRRSLDKGLWKGAYAATNPDEFIAELVMWYFGFRGDLAMAPPRPANGAEGLRAYDPEAYALLDDLFSGRLPSKLRRPAALAARPASAEAALRSADGPATTVRFRNQTPHDVLLFWIDTEGKRQPYGSLKAGETREQSTYAGHVWLAADAKGQALSLFVAEPREGMAVIKQAH